MSDESNSSDSNDYTLGDKLFVVGLLLIAILVPALIVKRHFLGPVSPFDWSPGIILGIVAALLALALDAYNLHMGYLRPWLHLRRHGNMNDYRHISGAPLLGAILVLFAALFLPASPMIGVCLLLLYLLDPAGFHVAAFVFLREMSDGRAE